jgi:hypothetical protein
MLYNLICWDLWWFLIIGYRIMPGLEVTKMCDERLHIISIGDVIFCGVDMIARLLGGFVSLYKAEPIKSQ